MDESTCSESPPEISEDIEKVEDETPLVVTTYPTQLIIPPHAVRITVTWFLLIPSPLFKT